MNLDPDKKFYFTRSQMLRIKTWNTRTTVMALVAGCSLGIGLTLTYHLWSWSYAATFAVLCLGYGVGWVSHKLDR
jgi:hypothetical protein